GQTQTSSINVTDNFILQNVIVSLDISMQDDTQLSAVLIAPDSTRIPLFTQLSRPGADFTNTVFDDAATTPIQNGAPSYLGRFNPQVPLSTLLSPARFSAGLWQLEITNSSSSVAGTLNSWSLTLRKPVLSTGLGELVADQFTTTFRIFTMDPA